MRTSDHIRQSIDLWERNELEASMLFACVAVDGTARKVHPKLGNKGRFTRILRDNYAILGPMGAPGIDLVRTRFPVSVRNPTTTDGKPDLADVLYGVHRCCHAHGDELPAGFDLIPNAAGPKRYTCMLFERGKMRLSDRVIFGLLAVCVLAPTNSDQSDPALNGYFLRYGDQPPLFINEWWGRAKDFDAVAAEDKAPSVLMDFGDWMQ